MLQVISYMTKLRHYAQKKLHTTVEEDSSNREYFQEVKEREERAVSEKVQLEQKLKVGTLSCHILHCWQWNLLNSHPDLPLPFCCHLLS